MAGPAVPARRRTGCPSREGQPVRRRAGDRKSTRLNSSHSHISYAVFCLKKKIRKPATVPHLPQEVTLPEPQSARAAERTTPQSGANFDDSIAALAGVLNVPHFTRDSPAC